LARKRHFVLKVVSDELQIDAKNEIKKPICVEFDANLINISKIISCETKWPQN